ncbi:right-handed parallel beta-helix repeat-containing protein [Calditrichota bacterium GD2]
MMKWLSIIWALLLCVILPQQGVATTYYVWVTGNDSSGTGLDWTNPFATLQKAVAEAQDGDTILVGYNETFGTEYSLNSMIIVNKALTISSARFALDLTYSSAVPDSAKCLFNANFACRFMHITRAVELRGLGFKKGNGAVGTAYWYGYGGAILLEDSASGSSIIHHCWFDSNYAALGESDGYGGAIAAINTENGPIIRHNTFTNNVASTESSTSDYDAGNGGAIYTYSSLGLRIENNQFQNNVAGQSHDGYGGAVAIFGSDSLAVIQENHFSGNWASLARKGSGGALFIENFGQVIRNTFEENGASACPIDDYSYFGIGGAIYARYGKERLRIASNQIRNNVAVAATANVGGQGGGIYLWQCEQTVIENNVIEGNIACANSNNSGSGGGIKASGTGTNVIIRNNTIRQNIASYYSGWGGGINISGNGLLEKNTIAENVASNSDDENAAGKGGGIFTDDGNVYVIENTIEGNVGYNGSQGTGWGGGMVASGYNNGAIIVRNLFKDNIATKGMVAKGGALFIADTSKVFYNIFYHNIANTNPDAFEYDGYRGDGIYIYYNAKSELRIYHNVFFRNANAIYAEELYYDYLNEYNIVNNIFYNTPQERAVLVIDTEADISIYNNCFFGYKLNAKGVPLKYDSWYVDSYDEVDADPRMDTTTFALRFDSPCIDAGLGDYDYDEAGNHHLGWRRDIGAFEYQGTQVRRYLSSEDVGKTVYFGGQARAKIQLNQATLSDSAYIDVTVHPGALPAGVSGAVQRYYTITASGLENFDLDLTLSYKDSELNNQPEAQLRLLRQEGIHWTGPFFTAADTAANWVRAEHVTALSNWILTADTTLVGIASNADALPLTFQLYSAYPNPFNPATTIRFDVPRAAAVEVSVYNTLGQRVRTLVNEHLAPGKYRIQWDGRNQQGGVLPSGVYFVRMKTDGFTAVRKVMLIK